MFPQPPSVPDAAGPWEGGRPPPIRAGDPNQLLAVLPSPRSGPPLLPTPAVARVFTANTFTTSESACALEIPIIPGPWVMPAVPITVTIKSTGKAAPGFPEVTFSSWLQQMFLLLRLFFPVVFFFFFLGQSGRCELYSPGTWAGFSIYVSSISIYLYLCLFFTGF